MYSVSFKDKTNEDIGVTTLSIGRRQRAEEQLEIYDIPYSDRQEIRHTGKFRPYQRPIEFFVSDDGQVREINNWLYGLGRLRTVKDPGGYFKAHVLGPLDYKEYLLIRERVTVNFLVNPPFFYLDSGDTPLTLTAPGSIVNPGTHHAEPLIKVTGTGNIDIDINGEIVELTAVDGYLYIDCESQYCYKDTINQGDKMVGEFPLLPPGTNNITWTGTVTSIEIIPRWREL